MIESPREQILIAGIGNIFFGDDAFGVEVSNALSNLELPQKVAVIDFGIRGLDLVYSLLEPWRAVIFIDAISRGGKPGEIYLLEPDDDFETAASFDPHGMNPLQVLAAARSIGDISARIYIVACEPQSLGEELEGRMGLSPIVQQSVPQAVQAVLRLVTELMHPAVHTTAATAL